MTHLSPHLHAANPLVSDGASTPSQKGKDKPDLTGCLTWEQQEAAEWRWLEQQVIALRERAQANMKGVPNTNWLRMKDYLDMAEQDARFLAEEAEVG